MSFPVEFDAVRWQNLLSTGNEWTEVRLDRNTNTLVIGQNGAGKSTMLDALFLALFGKPFRKANLPQLVNSITGRDCLAEVEFRARNHHWRVRQGVKPKVFEVYRDGELVDQEADVKVDQKWLEDSVLGFNHKAAAQIVVLGSTNYVPFMQLPKGDRRAIVEDMLDIQVFSQMNQLLRARVDASRERVRSAETEARVVEEKIRVRDEFNDKHRSQVEAEIARLEAEVEKLGEESLAAQRRSTELSLKVDNLEDSVADEAENDSRIEAVLETRKEISRELRALREQLEFFRDHAECPTCSQTIGSEVRQSHQDQIMGRVERLMTDDEEQKRAHEKLSVRFRAIEAVRNAQDDLRDRIESERATISTNVRLAKQLVSQVERERTKLEEIHSDEDQLLESQRDAIMEELADAHKEARVLGQAQVLLKDGGIKARVIRQYVPVINKLINKYLAEMDFFVSFELDEEFNETIKSRYRDSFTYSLFSEGEKMRIDLAILFTWRALARLRSRSSCNLLVLDEVMDGSLDSNGVDDFIKIVDEIADTSVFVISHRGHTVIDKFSDVLRFEKIKNFSRIAA